MEVDNERLPDLCFCPTLALKFHPLSRGSSSPRTLATQPVCSRIFLFTRQPLLLICRVFHVAQYPQRCTFCFVEVRDRGWHVATTGGSGQASFVDQWEAAPFKWNLTQHCQAAGAKHPRESGGLMFKFEAAGVLRHHNPVSNHINKFKP